MVTIKKYKEPDGSIKNYFDNPTKVDEITFNSMPVDAFTRVTKRWIKNEAGYTIQCDNFTVKFSQLQTELSTHGKDIHDFIMDGNNLFVIMANVYGFIIGGTIAFSDTSPQADNTLSEWNLTFDCIGLEAEADKKLQTMAVEYLNSEMTFESYISFFFRNFVSSYAAVNNQLALSAGLSHWKGEPYTLLASKPLQNNIYSTGIANNSAKILSSLSKEMGFSWEIVFSSSQVTGSNYFNTELRLLWRDSGALKQIAPMTHLENIDTTNIMPYVLFPCMRKALMNDENTKEIGWVYCGVLMSKRNHWSVDQYAGNPKFLVYNEDYQSQSPFPNGAFHSKGLHWVSNQSGIPSFIPLTQLLIVEPDIWYNVNMLGTMIGGDIVYSRIFVRHTNYNSLHNYYDTDAGYNDILDYYTVPQNRFLASGACKTKRAKISLIHGDIYDIFDKMQVDTDYYFLYEMDMDIENYTAETIWKQITS